MNQQDHLAHFTGEIHEPEPVEEHGYDGTRHHECANYEGGVFACLCGDRFVDMGELREHITDALGHDPLQNLLESGHRIAEKLRGSRDTQAIRGANANTRMLLDALKGHL